MLALRRCWSRPSPNTSISPQLKYMGTWADAQAAARDGKADMIFGIYYNDERAAYLDYVQPAFMFDEVAIFVPKGKVPL